MPPSATHLREPFAVLQAYEYALADTEFYAPLGQVADAGGEFATSGVPARLVCPAFRHPEAARRSRCAPSRGLEDSRVRPRGPGAGSSRQGRRRLYCGAQACPRGRVFMVLHHKHGSRQQAGRFCAACRPDQQTARRLMGRLTSAFVGAWLEQLLGWYDSAHGLRVSRGLMGSS